MTIANKERMMSLKRLMGREGIGLFFKKVFIYSHCVAMVLLHIGLHKNIKGLLLKELPY